MDKIGIALKERDNTLDDIQKNIGEPNGYFPIALNRSVNIFPIGGKTNPFETMEEAVSFAANWIIDKEFTHNCWASALPVW